MSRLAFMVSLMITMMMLNACTSIGTHDDKARASIDFGPEETLRVCMLFDENSMSVQEAKTLVQAVTDELKLYAIKVEIPSLTALKPGKDHGYQMIPYLASLELVAPCDRMMALIGAHAEEVIGGLLGLSVQLGAVDTVTHTRGYVLCEMVCTSQIVTPPPQALIHESYHLLGCKHDSKMNACYERIRLLKQAARKNRERGNDFFPSYAYNGQLITRREQVNALESMALKVHLQKQGQYSTDR